MKMKRVNYLSIILLLMLPATVYAGNTTCKGKITNIHLNTDYNKGNIRYVINGVNAELNGGYWSEEMTKNVYTLMLSAQMSGKSVQYWGSEDCTLIHKNLTLLSE